MLKVDVEKNFNNFELRVKFEVENEILVLFGPSGSGKSTTLKLIAGLEEPDRGSIVNQKVQFFKRSTKANLAINKRNIGYVFQDYSLFPHMTVFENIAFGIRGRGLDKLEVKRKVNNLLTNLRLEGLSNNYPSELSGGQQQRVAIARALIIEPEILLMDEPFSALDTLVREKLRQDLLRVHREYQIPVIYVTHNLTDVFVLADQVAVYNQGRIEQLGSKEEIFYRPRTRDVARFVESKNIFDLVVEEVDGKFKLKNENLTLFAESKKELSMGQEVVAIIRPEFIELVTAEDEKARASENLYSGVLHKKLAKGAITRLFVNQFSQQGFDILIDVLTTRARDLNYGSELKFKIPPAKVHLIV
ncbi:ABC transporter ATP-binding protein [Fuchsiella alkaliacetigena]|uniref:ABC transporter ATP-binding protein n=1 Tax=Fuchsiella alkaliacetigena TaxID=957042 RepID=UPI00200B4D77|nr:ABC transporter ATP-binding protein [Fuchsiella alkaliacetigena]MCK8824794.1 ABC transporter ATP-binding protein [Fuchsiella alkaliacetigena]